MTKRLLLLGLGVATLIASWSADSRAAIVVSVSADAVAPQTFPLGNPGYPGDTISVSASGTPTPLSIEVPTAEPVLLQTGDFFINYSAGPGQPGTRDFLFDLTRNVTINGVSMSITQQALLHVDETADTLTVYDSSSVSFDVDGVGNVVLTALGTGPLRRDTLGSHSFDISSTFSVLAPPPPSVPEPGTFIVWSLLGGFGIALSYWRRKRPA